MLPNVSHVNMSDCRINQGGMVNILTAIQDRSKLEALVSLNLSHNLLGRDGARHLSTIIGGSKNYASQLTTLVLHHCGITDSLLSILCDGLKQNQSCTALNLAHNKLGSRSGSSLAEALKRVQVLTNLNLSWNSIRADGSMHLVEALENSPIVNLDVSMNSFGKSSAAAYFWKNTAKNFNRTIEFNREHGRFVCYMHIDERCSFP